MDIAHPMGILEILGSVKLGIFHRMNCLFVCSLVVGERRQRLLPPAIRRNLVLLIARWSGFYENMYNAR